MRILFVNDDGYDAMGLHAVAALFKDEHDIAVVAPKIQKSASSHSMSTHSPIYYEVVHGYDYSVFAVDGTPVDCAKFALSELFTHPDVVVSGINNGENLASDIMYSGTVAAAFEGVYFGLKGIALSIDIFGADKADYGRCAQWFKKNFEHLVSVELPPMTILNINFPSCVPVGVKAAKMSIARAFGDLYESDGDAYNYRGLREPKVYSDTDEAYCSDGYVTITPLTMDQTEYAALKKLKREKFEL